jgi:hypothetical protein
MANELIFYKTPDGEQRIEVVYEDENFWMSQRALADLFAVGVPAVNKHLKNIFESGELNEKGTISKMETVRQEGSREVRRTVDFYNLDAISNPRPASQFSKHFVIAKRYTLMVMCNVIRQPYAFHS